MDGITGCCDCCCWNAGALEGLHSNNIWRGIQVAQNTQLSGAGRGLTPMTEADNREESERAASAKEDEMAGDSIGGLLFWWWQLVMEEDEAAQGEKLTRQSTT